MYRVREVDADEYADELELLHRGTFLDATPLADFNEGFWWIAWFKRHHPVAFIGIRQSILGPHTGYFIRVGVMPEHRGQGLQRRLMRAMEQKAKKVGWVRIVSDTRDNPHSANNIIAAGYRMFTPDPPWGFTDACYWTKELK
ncbi:MAG: N-acetyltransferase [Hyphomicrobiaceae bacterium]|nr:MAG: N-acetyltransferase [Hyphomicrobiaceae bacterium]